MPADLSPRPGDPVRRMIGPVPRAIDPVRRVMDPVRRLSQEIADLAFASVCAGCGVVGTALCADCHRRLAPHVLRPSSLDGLPMRAGLSFDGVAASVLRAVKEDGQTSLIRVLRPALIAAVDQLRAGSVPVDPAGFAPLDRPDPWPVDRSRARRIDVVVPVPTSRAAFRRRGFRVPEMLARGAGIPVLPALRYARRVEDQRGLRIEQRRRNLAGGLIATRAGDGVTALVVDDVMTTGATCAEAARALRAAGFRVVGAAAVAATERRS